MAASKLKRKALRNKLTSRNRLQQIKRLMNKPEVRNVDVEAIKAEFEEMKKSKAAKAEAPKPEKTTQKEAEAPKQQKVENLEAKAPDASAKQPEDAKKAETEGTEKE